MTRTAQTPRPTRARQAEAAAYHHLAETLRDLEADLRRGLERSTRIPEIWTEIAQAPVQPKKVPVTLRLDEDVLRFFRSLGQGHTPRMNAVLRAFMLARLAGVVKGPEAVRYEPTPAEALEQEAAGCESALTAAAREIMYGANPEAAFRRISAKLDRIEALAGRVGG